MTNRKIEYWVIPPEADGEFVAHMEEVLETCARPYDPARPVLCMDEQPVPLLQETRVPIPATRRHGKRVDYEYERAGTANIFLFAEPLAGWREVAVRETKAKVDRAIEMALLREGRDADVERVVVVCDNLNTHTKGAFYESFYSSRFSGRAADVHVTWEAARLSWQARHLSPEIYRREITMPVAETSVQPMRGQKTICIPCSQEQYKRIVDDPVQFRAFLDRQIETTPELFPPEIRRGYRMKDIYPSRKTGWKLRRIELRNLQCYLVRPSFLMPYLSGRTEDVQAPLFSASSPSRTGP